MLEEAVEVMRELWKGGFADHHGEHYTVENARIYTLPEQPLPSTSPRFGPKATDVAGRIGDGFITTIAGREDDRGVPRRRRRREARPSRLQGVLGADGRRGVYDTAHRLWANSGVPGELAQVLPTPAALRAGQRAGHQGSTRDSIAYGADVDRHVAAFRPFADAGVDVVHISQMGGSEPKTSAAGFFEFYGDQVLPRLREIA